MQVEFFLRNKQIWYWKEKIKMKKSRIILPAVALLTISTVAAASSTVAWFSATREITIRQMK